MAKENVFLTLNEDQRLIRCIKAMPRDTSFHDYVTYDLLQNAPGITSRAMFGGWGIYKNGIIFAIIVESELYFKVNDQNRSEFEKIGSHPFVYKKADGKQVSMSYWVICEEIMENRELFINLMETSIAIGQNKNGK